MTSEDPAGVFGGLICGTQTVTENLPQCSGETNDKMMCCEGLFYIHLITESFFDSNVSKQ